MRAAVCILLILITTSCNKDEFTEITRQCKFTDDLITPCFSAIHKSGYDQIIIKDNKAYQEFQDSIRDEIYGLDCEAAELSPVNFSKYILIGKRTSGGGCSADFSRRIFIDTGSKTVKYQISIRYSGNCAMLISSWNWAFIPKPSDDYNFEFVVTQKQDSWKR